MSVAAFELDARLAADTHPLADWPLSRVLLMDDARYPWLILVPRKPGLVDLTDLLREERHELSDELHAAGMALQNCFQPDKLNVASLGNVVRQLHVHVVARWRVDAAGAAPIWGVGERQPYEPAALADIKDQLRPYLLRP